MCKKIVSSLLCIILLATSLGIVGNAEESNNNQIVYLNESGEEIPMPYWDYTATTWINLDFKDGRVYMDASILGHQNLCAYITARAQLEKKNADGSYSVLVTYLDLTTQNSDVPSSFSFSRNRLASVNDSYRFTVYATVYGKSGGSEPITLQTTGTYYP